jgi:DNA polymerase-3 subunit alpha
LLDGFCKIPDLVARAKEMGQPAVAITDHGRMFGVIEFYKECQKQGVHPILGCEVYFAQDRSMQEKPKAIIKEIAKKHKLPKDVKIDDLIKTVHSNPTQAMEVLYKVFDGDMDEAEELFWEIDALGLDNYHLILWAKSEEGLKNLYQIATDAETNGFYYHGRTDMSVLRQYGKGIIAASACLAGRIPHLLAAGKYEAAKEAALAYADCFEGFYLEIQPNALPQQALVNSALCALAKDTGLPLVVTCDSHYVTREDYDAHEVLLCMQMHKTLEDEDRMKFIDDFWLKTEAEVREGLIYLDQADVEQAINNTVKIADECQVEIKFGDPLFPTYDGDAEADLTKQCKGELFKHSIRHRETNYGEYSRRLNYELDVIIKAGFAPYFLLIQEMITWAREHGIMVGPGRGSAGGSLVAKLLGITELDPIEYDLLFERFLNSERVELPDIDMDYSYERRGEVFQHAMEKYGKDNVAHICTFGTMQMRSVLKDVGRVLGLPFQELNNLSKAIPEDAETLADAIAGSPDIAAYQVLHQELFKYALAIEGMPKSVGTHASGVVITPEPIVNYMPLFRDKDGELVTQYEMHNAEELGVVKVDVLGLKTLDVIQKAQANIEQPVDINKIKLDDPEVFTLYQQGKTDGIFQVEGDAFRRMLKKMRPTSFEDIIAAVALFRPGPLGSGIVDDFIDRKHGDAEVAYLHPDLEPALCNTYGCIAKDSQVYLANGLTKNIQDVVVDDYVLSMDDDGTIVVDRINVVHDNGTRPVYKLTLNNGYTVKATGDHKFLINGEWAMLQSAKENDLIGVPREIHESHLGDYSVNRIKLLGYYLANGRYVSSIEWCSKNERLLDDFRKCCSAAFSDDHIHEITGLRDVTRYYVVKNSDSEKEYHSPSSFGQWLTDLGLRHEDSHDKFIPDFVFSRNNACKSRFLAALFDCDGHIADRHITYKTVSEQLAYDVQRLLLLLGIVSHINVTEYVSDNHPDGKAYTVLIYDRIRFYQLIGQYMISGKCDKSIAFGECFMKVPFGPVKDYVRDLRNTFSLTDISRQCNVHRHTFIQDTRNKVGVSRYAVDSLNQNFENNALRSLLNLNWCRVDSVEYLGEEQVYDLTTNNHHNYVVNGTIVHNCMIYQEQVMQTARILAGYTIGQSDGLRKAVGKKSADLIAEHRAYFIDGSVERDILGAVNNGYDRDLANQIYDAIEYFGKYGFNRSHSAAYGLLSYQTAWLKYYYPAEFMTAVLSMEDTQEKIAHYVDVARDMDIEILPPDVNTSLQAFSCVRRGVGNTAILMGLQSIKGLGGKAVDKIVANAPFQDFEDFCARAKINKAQMVNVIKSGALDRFAQYESGAKTVATRGAQIAMAIAGEQAKVINRNAMINYYFETVRTAVKEEKPEELPPCTAKQVREYEVEILGIPVTALSDWERAKDGDKIRLKGDIIDLREWEDKRHRVMAFLTVASGKESREVIVFSTQWSKLQGSLEIGKKVSITGKKSQNKLVLDKVG